MTASKKTHFTSALTAFFVLICFVSFAQNIKVSANINTIEVEENEEFQVQYSIEISGNFTEEIENLGIGDCKGIENLGAQSSGQSSNTSIINGKTTRSVKYLFTNAFKANKTGSYTIPPYQVRYDGKNYNSNTVRVKVNKIKVINGVSGNYGIKADISKTTYFVGESFRLDINFWSAVNISALEFSETPTFEGFSVKQIETKSQLKVKNIGDKKYLYGKKASFLLTPSKSGKLKIAEINAVLQLQARSFFERGKQVKISTKPITVTILPIPNGGPNFSEIVGNYQLKVKADKNELAVNDAITLKYTFKGVGNIGTFNNLQPQFPKSFETLPVTTKENLSITSEGYAGSKTYEFVCIPRVAGEFTIPPLNIEIFNPKTKKFQTLTTQEQTFKITGSSNSVGNQFSGGASKNLVTSQSSDIRHIKSNVVLENISSNSRFAGSLWHYGLLTITGFSFLGIYFLTREKKLTSAEIKSAKKSKAYKHAMQILKKAKSLLNQDEKQLVAEVENALQTYLQGKLMMDQSKFNKLAIQEELKSNQVSEEGIKNITTVFEHCKMARYAPISVSHQQLLTDTEHAINQVEKEL